MFRSSTGRLFARHTFGKDLALYDLMCGFALHHALAGKCLTALVTGAVAGRMVFCDAFDQALYQSPSPALSVLVQQRFARRAVYENGPYISACQREITLTRSGTVRLLYAALLAGRADRL